MPCGRMTILLTRSVECLIVKTDHHSGMTGTPGERLTSAKVVAQEPGAGRRIDRSRILAHVEQALTHHWRAPGLSRKEQPDTVQDSRP